MRLRHGEPAFSNRLNPLPNGPGAQLPPARVGTKLRPDAARASSRSRAAAGLPRPPIDQAAGGQLQRLVRRRPTERVRGLPDRRMSPRIGSTTGERSTQSRGRGGE
jgi:hypothetical protein